MTNFAFMTEAKDPANGNHFSLRRACHPPGQCYFQALSWTGCGSCACRWEPGVAEEAVRSDCPLSVLPARWTGWMRNVSSTSLIFRCQYHFMVLNPGRAREN